MDKEEAKSQETIDHGEISDSEWENRILCRDGNCIGVIGANGRCNECGLICDASQQPDDNFEHDDIAEIDGDDVAAVIDTHDAACDDHVADDPDTFESVDDQNAFIPNSDWENRTLCSDGNCIGVIGPDGCCGECGKAYDSVDDLSGVA